VPRSDILIIVSFVRIFVVVVVVVTLLTRKSPTLRILSTERKRREQKRRSEELRIYHREGVLALGCTRTKLLCCCCKCSTVTKRTTFYVLLCNVICTHTRARDILITRFHLLREYHHSIISRTPRSSLPLLTR
jgi:hypothetical protein